MSEPTVQGCGAGASSLSIDERMYVDCTSCGTSGSVWGSGIYTYDSDICTAAAHEGRSGVVTVVGAAGQSSYTGATNNGITTSSWGFSMSRSFVFDPQLGCFPNPCNGGDCTLSGSSAVCSNCPVGTTGTNCEISVSTNCNQDGTNLSSGDTLYVDCTNCPTSGSVWGSDIYASDSKFCVAAAFEGRAGIVMVQHAPGQSSYTGSTRNGITTQSYGSWFDSFIFPN